MGGGGVPAAEVLQVAVRAAAGVLRQRPAQVEDVGGGAGQVGLGAVVLQPAGVDRGGARTTASKAGVLRLRSGWAAAGYRRHWEGQNATGED